MGEVQDERDLSVLGWSELKPEEKRAINELAQSSAVGDWFERLAGAEREQLTRFVEACGSSGLDRVKTTAERAEGLMSARATPARPLRVRVCLDPVDGPAWLGLLAQCAWLRGGIVGVQA